MSSFDLQTQPYKGSRDFYPIDMAIRNFIFNNWRKVCQKYGYEEYDGPFIEAFDIYAAKSGEELVNEQLYSFEDRGKRKVAIRPEMTPTLARMVAQKFNELPQPIRWFSIPNLWRYEKPQKGRLREHFQLNVDIFGVESVFAETEILSIVVDILKEFGAKEGMFEIRIGNRRFIEDVYRYFEIPTESFSAVTSSLDKFSKITLEDFENMLVEKAGLTSTVVKKFSDFVKNPAEILTELSTVSQGAQEIKALFEMAKNAGIDGFLKYDPSIVRGLDYYTGCVFELFDLSPEGLRAMAGGGRYDDLVESFIGKKLTGIGFGMGDVTFRNFLENWGLLPDIRPNCEYFITVWPSEDSKFLQASMEVAKILREKGKNVQLWPSTDDKLEKQLKYADKKGLTYAVIIGENEIKEGSVTIKDLESKSQKTKPLEEFFKEVK